MQETNASQRPGAVNYREATFEQILQHVLHKEQEFAKSRSDVADPGFSRYVYEDSKTTDPARIPFSKTMFRFDEQKDERERKKKERELYMETLRTTITHPDLLATTTHRRNTDSAAWGNPAPT